MAAGVELEGDRAVVVKRATAATANSLRLEGERLERASHPGVVQVVSSQSVGEGWELRTAHAGRPLSILDPLSVAQVAGLIASLASTLADLHQLGLVHGRVEASHVLVGDQGRPVLCGVGDGAAPGTEEDDVAALGNLLVDLVGADDDGEPIPERRWRGRRRWSGWDRRALLLLADQACAEPATRRPSARRLAAAIADAVPDLARPAAEPTLHGGRPLEARPGNDPTESLRASALVDSDERTVRPLAMALAALGGLLLILGATRLRGGDAEEVAGPVDPPEAAVVVPSTTTPEAALRTAVPIPGSLLEVGGLQYRVGQAGDEVLVEDWDCDGTPTPALLRPATGEVFVFPRWIEHDELAVEPVLQVAGAEDLVSEVAPDGCPTLAVRSSSGEVVPVIQGPR